MLKRALICLLVAGALVATALPAAAVSLPWTDENKPGAATPGISLDLKAMTDALGDAGASGLDGLMAARPNSAQGALAALVRAALKRAPWLSEAEADGLWTWSRNPVRGVAVYGPGIGGYSSFSWSRHARAPDDALTKLRNRSAAEQAALLLKVSRKGGGGHGAPTPVPLPPGAILLGAAIGMTALVRRRRQG